jgi:pyridoxamine 5'-phosphate oxidase
MRLSYEGTGLHEADLKVGWLETLRRWLDDAVEAQVPEPNAMVLATADADARPGGRTVLLKRLDERGLVFFTNLDSRKGHDLEENPRAALVFLWIGLRRQVVVEGAVEPLAAGDSDAYFASRPRGAQLGAAASPQSQPIASREELDRLFAELAERHPDSVPRPQRWGGLRVVPERVEFWQGRRDRLHDRLRFVREDGRWRLERLAP